jgi:hypothetical protein
VTLEALAEAIYEFCSSMTRAALLAHCRELACGACFG